MYLTIYVHICFAVFRVFCFVGQSSTLCVIDKHIKRKQRMRKKIRGQHALQHTTSWALLSTCNKFPDMSPPDEITKLPLPHLCLAKIYGLNKRTLIKEIYLNLSSSSLLIFLC